jgi:hypothetical protein
MRQAQETARDGTARSVYSFSSPPVAALDCTGAGPFAGGALRALPLLSFAPAKYRRRGYIACQPRETVAYLKSLLTGATDLQSVSGTTVFDAA